MKVEIRPWLAIPWTTIAEGHGGAEHAGTGALAAAIALRSPCEVRFSEDANRVTFTVNNNGSMEHDAGTDTEAAGWARLILRHATRG